MAKRNPSSAAKSPKDPAPTGDPVLGRAIRDIRLKKGLKLHEVGPSKSLLSQYESGKTMPTVANLKLIGEKLGVGVDALLWGAEAVRFNKSADAAPMAKLDRRIHDLPEPMREFVLIALARAESAVTHVPALFMTPPNSENWSRFAAYLEALYAKDHQK